jgi:peptidoglycan/xylan/chitin deacetylase (PgdA/CDA1 family)
MPVEPSYVVPELRPGMDHDYYDYRPLDARRPVLRWPQGARVALCVIVTLEHIDWRKPPESYQSPTLSGGYGNHPFPDITRWSHREYGHRVGVFRVLDALERHGIPATVAMDALTAEHYPFLVRHCLGRGCELIAHGVSVSRMITSAMPEETERDYIRTSVEALTRATGRAPLGWLGPEYGESARTPALLAEAGLRYVGDWVNDEQPYRLRVPKGELYALPVTYPLDDVDALWDRRLEVDRYAGILMEAFDRLYRDGAENGRLLVLNLHPWLSGQAFRIGAIDRALGYLTGREGVWAATGSEIIDWYRAHPPAGEPAIG